MIHFYIFTMFMIIVLNTEYPTKKMKELLITHASIFQTRISLTFSASENSESSDSFKMIFQARRQESSAFGLQECARTSPVSWVLVPEEGGLVDCGLGVWLKHEPVGGMIRLG